MKSLLTSHTSHDYRFLVQRWKDLARKSGLKILAFTKAGGHSIYVVASASQKLEPAIYISAGVHGDEPAPPWGLLEWAEENVDLLKLRPFILYPCLNPHGLINNTRVDQRGVDINRTFHDEGEPLISAWRQTFMKQSLHIGIHLHEDYDAQGIYAYELNQTDTLHGHKILADCSGIIPIDQRGKMDGRKANGGLINRRKIPTDLPGYPEAIALYHLGAPITLTFESPSEFGLMERIAVQKKFIESALHHVCGL
jgi:protein MpaA